MPESDKSCSVEWEGLLAAAQAYYVARVASGAPKADCKLLASVIALIWQVKK